VPDAKLEKWIIDRRVDILEQEGIEFVYNVDAGRDVSAEQLRDRYDALVVSIGSRVSRDLPAPGRELEGIHLAMDYLYQRNRWVPPSRAGRTECPRPAPRSPPRTSA
jgi:NADPH-dependent glutamate synthase beta chain and related oxidoreductases